MRGSWIFTLLAPVALAACESTGRELLKPPEKQATLRAMQTRAFDSTDDLAILRSVIATLQDLGFVIDSAHAPLGIVSATRLENGSARITVTVRRQGEHQTLVRASVQVGLKTATDPLAYQEFFAALSKGMFLTAHAVN